MLPPAMPFTVETTGTEAIVYRGACLLRGWAFQETTNAAGAELDIYDGDVSADLLVAPITLATNESTRDYPPGDGIMIRTYPFVYVLSGEIRGSLWITPLSHALDIEWVFGERGPFYLRDGS